MGRRHHRHPRTPGQGVAVVAVQTRRHSGCRCHTTHGTRPLLPSQNHGAGRGMAWLSPPTCGTPPPPPWSNPGAGRGRGRGRGADIEEHCKGVQWSEEERSCWHACLLAKVRVWMLLVAAAVHVCLVCPNAGQASRRRPSPSRSKVRTPSVVLLLKGPSQSCKFRFQPTLLKMTPAKFIRLSVQQYTRRPILCYIYLAACCTALVYICVQPTL